MFFKDPISQKPAVSVAPTRPGLEAPARPLKVKGHRSRSSPLCAPTTRPNKPGPRSDPARSSGAPAGRRPTPETAKTPPGGVHATLSPHTGLRNHLPPPDGRREGGMPADFSPARGRTTAGPGEQPWPRRVTCDSPTSRGRESLRGTRHANTSRTACPRKAGHKGINAVCPAQTRQNHGDTKQNGDQLGRGRRLEGEGSARRRVPETDRGRCTGT